MQLFAEADLKNQSSKSLEKGIENFKKEIIKHNEKIAHPEKYYSDWESVSEEIKMGRIKHWKKEIENFEKGIRNREEELYRREMQ